MDFQIAMLLGQDGITNGAIYALLALALVLVFAVTRVIFIPQGEFVAYGALTLAALQAGGFRPRCGCCWRWGLAALIDGTAAALRSGATRKLPGVAGWNLAYPLLLAGLFYTLPLETLPMLAQVLLALAVVVPLGPLMYRLAFQPVAGRRC